MTDKKMGIPGWKDPDFRDKVYRFTNPETRTVFDADPCAARAKLLEYVRPGAVFVSVSRARRQAAIIRDEDGARPHVLQELRPRSARVSVKDGSAAAFFLQL